ncbi:MAG TPA: polysaccharide deacetylase family protein [Acidobacteriota bacterium]
MPRFDRFATLWFFNRLIPRMVPNGVRIPILMYHSISQGNSDAGCSYYDVVTAPRIFHAHMKFLFDNAYCVINLADAAQLVQTGTDPNKRYVALTFDDGYQDFYTAAVPIMDRYGFTATVFLPTRYINNSRAKFKQRCCLTWPEVRALTDRGIRFGSHTVSHSRLTTLTRDSLEYEIRESKSKIEDETGMGVQSFAYPYAYPETNKKFRAELNEILRRTGYTNGVTTIVGTASGKDNPFSLKRLPVNSFDDICFFRAKLDGSYDWIHKLQYGEKFVRATYSAMVKSHG